MKKYRYIYIRFTNKKEEEIFMYILFQTEAAAERITYIHVVYE